MKTSQKITVAVVIFILVEAMGISVMWVSKGNPEQMAATLGMTHYLALVLAVFSFVATSHP